MTKARQIPLLFATLLFLYFVLTYGFYAGIASRAPGANDYFSRWMGAREFFLRGIDPYSDAATQQIQIGMYGRLARADEDQVAFAYPLYAALFTLPFLNMPYAWAESFWIALLILLVGGVALALARYFHWSLSPLGLLGLLGFTFLFYPITRGIFLGQFTLVVLASLAGGIALVGWGRDGWAGWVLALSTVKPHVALIALGVVLSWALWHKRWRLLYAFFGAMALLLAFSFLLLPSWLSEFFAAVGAYQTYIQIGPPVQVLSELFLPAQWAQVVVWLVVLALLSALAIQWRQAIHSDWNAFLPTVELAMLVTTFVMIRTATTDQAMLLLIWIHWLARLTRAGYGRWAVLVGASIVCIPWFVFLITLAGSQEAPIATTVVVVLTLAAYWILPVFRDLPLSPLGESGRVAT
jgi:hypothetical protein